MFATGSRPFVPPIAGTSLHGVFVFRTLDDCRNIAEYAKDCKTAVVIGGGLLGLEAAKGLMTHNVKVTVVEMGPWLMGVQLDADGGKVLQQTIEKLGITALTGASTKEFAGDETNRVKGVKFADGSIVECDMVVVSAGIRPNKELAAECGLACDRAILVDDTLQTNDSSIYGVGECVQHRGMVYGLVAPIWEQTKTLALRLTGLNSAATYTGSKLATKLKVMGVELASMGRIADVKPTDEVVTFAEPARQVYWKAIVREGKVVASCMLGDLGPADGLVDYFMTEKPAIPSARTLLQREHADPRHRNFARRPARRQADLRLQRRLQGHHRRGDSGRENQRADGRQGDAGRHGLRLVQEDDRRIDRSRGRGGEGRPERIVVRPRRAARQADARGRVQEARAEKRLGGARGTGHPRR